MVYSMSLSIKVQLFSPYNQGWLCPRTKKIHCWWSVQIDTHCKHSFCNQFHVPMLVVCNKQYLFHGNSNCLQNNYIKYSLLTPLILVSVVFTVIWKKKNILTLLWWELSNFLVWQVKFNGFLNLDKCASSKGFSISCKTFWLRILKKWIFLALCSFSMLKINFDFLKPVF